jgi:hypothetical protein
MSPSLPSVWDGYLGIEPYTANLDRKEQNFMYQLKASGKISHITASFYIRAAAGNSSIIKFGSYDEQGIAPGMAMATYKTKSISSWNLMGRNIKTNGHNITKGQQREFSFDMQLPYLYLPYRDWVSWAEAMAQFNFNMHCSPLHNYCRFNQNCNSVKLDQWFFEFDLFDGTIANNYALPSTNSFLISGDTLGDSVDTCYLPVFQSNYDDGTIYVGNLFMNYFYMVFDMSPYDEHNQNYITVSIAPINPTNIVGQEFYKPNGTDPVKPANDSSSTDNSTVPIPDPGPPIPTPSQNTTTNGTTNGTSPE